MSSTTRLRKRDQAPPGAVTAPRTPAREQCNALSSPICWPISLRRRGRSETGRTRRDPALALDVIEAASGRPWIASDRANAARHRRRPRATPRSTLLVGTSRWRWPAPGQPRRWATPPRRCSRVPAICFAARHDASLFELAGAGVDTRRAACAPESASPGPEGQRPCRSVPGGGASQLEARCCVRPRQDAAAVDFACRGRGRTDRHDDRPQRGRDLPCSTTTWASSYHRAGRRVLHVVDQVADRSRSWRLPLTSGRQPSARRQSPPS